MNAYNDLTRLHADISSLRGELQQQGLLTAVLEQRLKAIEKDVNDLNLHSEGHFVSLARYLPVEKAVFGVIGLILVSFIGAILALVVQS